VDLSLGSLNLSQRDLVTLKRALTDSEIAAVLEDPTVRQGIAQLVIYRNPLIANIPRMSPASAGQAAAIVTRRALTPIASLRTRVLRLRLASRSEQSQHV